MDMQETDQSGKNCSGTHRAGIRGDGIPTFRMNLAAHFVEQDETGAYSRRTILLIALTVSDDLVV
jgi:hypothetical protein